MSQVNHAHNSKGHLEIMAALGGIVERNEIFGRFLKKFLLEVSHFCMMV